VDREWNSLFLCVDVLILVNVQFRVFAILVGCLLLCEKTFGLKQIINDEI
jgi:hypothetical protein